MYVLCVHMCMKIGGKLAWDTTSADLSNLSNSVGDPCNGFSPVAVSKAHGLTNYYRPKKTVWDDTLRTLRTDRQTDGRTDNDR